MASVADLLEIMKTLRDPERGCPWDVEQTSESIAPHTIEEAYEVVEAIESGDFPALCDELGDLLFQVVFHAQMASESGSFDFADVVNAIREKLVRRHPHVFGDAVIESAEQQVRAWEEHKIAEWAARPGADRQPASAVDGVTSTLPALTRAGKLHARASRLPLFSSGLEPGVDRVAAELEQLREELSGGRRPERIAEELGDLLFAAGSLARGLGIDPEQALRATNRRFEARVRRIEAGLASEGRSAEDAAPSEFPSLWARAKAEERG